MPEKSRPTVRQVATGTVHRGRQRKFWRGLLGILVILASLWSGLVCAGGSDDKLLRRYAQCLADSNTVLHRQTFATATGAVPLSVEAVEDWLQERLETGELTMAEIRATYARHCR